MVNSIEEALKHLKDINEEQKPEVDFLDTIADKDWDELSDEDRIAISDEIYKALEGRHLVLEYWYEINNDLHQDPGAWETYYDDDYFDLEVDDDFTDIDHVNFNVKNSKGDVAKDFNLKFKDIKQLANATPYAFVQFFRDLSDDELAYILNHYDDGNEWEIDWEAWREAEHDAELDYGDYLYHAAKEAQWESLDNYNKVANDEIDTFAESIKDKDWDELSDEEFDKFYNIEKRVIGSETNPIKGSYVYGEMDRQTGFLDTQDFNNELSIDTIYNGGDELVLHLSTGFENGWIEGDVHIKLNDIEGFEDADWTPYNWLMFYKTLTKDKLTKIIQKLEPDIDWEDHDDYE